MTLQRRARSDSQWIWSRFVSSRRSSNVTNGRHFASLGHFIIVIRLLLAAEIVRCVDGTSRVETTRLYKFTYAPTYALRYLRSHERMQKFLSCRDIFEIHFQSSYVFYYVSYVF